MVLNEYFKSKSLEINGNSNSVDSFAALFAYMSLKYGNSKPYFMGLGYYKIETKIKDLYVCVYFESYGHLTIRLEGTLSVFKVSEQVFKDEYMKYLKGYAAWVKDKYDYVCYDYLNEKDRRKMLSDYISAYKEPSIIAKDVFLQTYGQCSEKNQNYLKEYMSFNEDNVENPKMQEYVNAGKQVVDSFFEPIGGNHARFNCFGLIAK